MTSDSRDVSDAQSMRALAHPLRLALLDALRAEGELTASRAAELLGDSPGNMSWHLQTLARYGFVEESGTGKGRTRPWRLAQRHIEFHSSGGTAEADAAGAAVEAAVVSSSLTQLEAWWRQRPDQPDWARASFVNTAVRVLTPQQATQLSREISELIARYPDGADSEDPVDGAEPVRILTVGHPLLYDG